MILVQSIIYETLTRIDLIKFCSYIIKNNRKKQHEPSIASASGFD